MSGFVGQLLSEAKSRESALRSRVAELEAELAKRGGCGADKVEVGKEILQKLVETNMGRDLCLI